MESHQIGLITAIKYYNAVGDGLCQAIHYVYLNVSVELTVRGFHINGLLVTVNK